MRGSVGLVALAQESFLIILVYTHVRRKQRNCKVWYYCVVALGTNPCVFPVNLWWGQQFSSLHEFLDL